MANRAENLRMVLDEDAGAKSCVTSACCFPFDHKKDTSSSEDEHACDLPWWRQDEQRATKRATRKKNLNANTALGVTETQNSLRRSNLKTLDGQSHSEAQAVMPPLVARNRVPRRLLPCSQ